MSPLLESLSPSMQNLGEALKLLLPSFLPSFLLVIKICNGTYSAHEIGAPPKTKTNLVQRLLVQFGHGDSITPSFVATIVVTIYFFKIQCMEVAEVLTYNFAPWFSWRSFFFLALGCCCINCILHDVKYKIFGLNSLFFKLVDLLCWGVFQIIHSIAHCINHLLFLPI
jgi:hypothetical protein